MIETSFFFLSLSLSCLIAPPSLRYVSLFLVDWKLFLIVYLFLKCTLEDVDEAGGGGGGAPLSLILTIVSIC